MKPPANAVVSDASKSMEMMNSDFDDGEDKLGLTVCLDTEQVDGNNGEEEDGAEHGLVEAVVPVPNR